MTIRRTRGSFGGAQGGRPTALRLRARVLIAAVTLGCVASIATGLVLLARTPAAERVPMSQRLAAAQAPSAQQPVPQSTQQPAPGTTAARPPSVANRSERTTGWPVHSAALPPARADQNGRPTRLDVPALGLQLPVRPTGVDAHGAMALPPRPGDLGWYRYSARPGDSTGSTVLGGHVDSKVYGTGPLVELWRLQPGDRMVLQTTAGRRVYLVVAVQRIAKTDLDPAVVFARTGPPALRLLTCGGPYLPARGGYQDNVVVTARPR